jgi:hypothetical protein
MKGFTSGLFAMCYGDLKMDEEFYILRCNAM